MNNLQKANRCLKCKVAKCRESCPVYTDIPAAMHLYEEGKLEEAGELLFNNNPMRTAGLRKRACLPQEMW